MQIVVNTNSLLTPLTGIGQYTYQVSKALRELDRENDYTYYYGFFSPELFRNTGESASGPAGPEQQKIRFYQQVKQSLKKIPLIGPVGRELRTTFSRTLQMVAGRKFDLYFEPNFIPLPEIRARNVVTMVFDLSVLLYPQWHPQERVRIFKRHFARGLKRSDVVLTSTQFIRGQILEHLNVPAEKLAVTPISCNKEIFRPHDAEECRRFAEQNRIPENFLVFVGSIEPRKNITGLLKAFLALPERVRKELSIVFCGPSGWKNADVYKFIEENGLLEKIRFMHYISDQNLAYLYNRATALVYPSFYEGFGLPPLEALCCGCPVVASDIPPHREVCGDAALYCDPASPESIARQIERAFDSRALRGELRAKGLAQAAKFDWNTTARQTLEVFRRFRPAVPAP